MANVSRSFRRAFAAGACVMVTAVLTPSAAHGGQAPAATSAAAGRCGFFAAVGRDLVTALEDPATPDQCRTETTFANGFPTQPRTMTDVDIDANAGDRAFTTWATYGTALHHVTMKTSWENGSPVDTVTDVPHGSGWQGIRLLVGPGWYASLYAIHDDGRFRRYTVTPTGVRSAGTQPGFGRVKTMTVIGEYPDRDVLLVTLTTGQLSVVRIPRTTALAATSSQIRARSWQGFEAIAWHDTFQPGAMNVLSGFDADTHRWYAYDMADATKGLATVIRPGGSMGTTVPGPPISLAITPRPKSGGG